MSEFFYLFLGVLLCAVLRLAGRLLGFVGVLVLCCWFMMAVGGKLGSTPIAFFGFHQSNFGNVFYAPVLFGTLMCVKKWGREFALLQIRAVILVLVVRWSVLSLVSVSPTSMASAVVNHPPGGDFVLLWAATIAFVFANGVVLFVMRHARGWYVYPLALVLAQMVDSLLFFPLASSQLKGVNLMDAMLGGVVLKSAISVCAVPLLWKLREDADEYVLPNSSTVFPFDSTAPVPGPGPDKLDRLGEPRR